jgi:hypothetical protein
LDGSSEEAVKEWDYQLQNFFNVFNGSPLATERNMWARLVDLYIKFAGMHADHCTKEKKNFVLMKEKKIAATEQIYLERSELWMTQLISLCHIFWLQIKL